MPDLCLWRIIGRDGRPVKRQRLRAPRTAKGGSGSHGRSVPPGARGAESRWRPDPGPPPQARTRSSPRTTPPVEKYVRHWNGILDRVNLRPQRPCRSLLYVPASSERMVAKAATRGADVLVLDLEDGVHHSQKDAARERLRDSRAAAAAAGALVALRTNPPAGAIGRGDLEAAADAGFDAVLLPKAETAEAASEAYRALGEATPLWLMIETARGAANAFELAPRGRTVLRSRTAAVRGGSVGSNPSGDCAASASAGPVPRRIISRDGTHRKEIAPPSPAHRRRRIPRNSTNTA